VNCESCVSFDDLFTAAQGRQMTLDEQKQLKQLAQVELNQWVREQVALTAGRMWCKDTQGDDGVIYAAFGWR
jgi:hypothetical protein